MRHIGGLVVSIEYETIRVVLNTYIHFASSPIIDGRWGVSIPYLEIQIIYVVEEC